MSHTRGTTLPEMLCITTLIALATLAVIPTAATLARGGRMAAGARDLALTFHALRWKSVAENRSHGLYFEQADGEWHWYRVRDGNGNGLRTAEVKNGTDPILSGPHRTRDRVSGVDPGFPGEGPFPRVRGGGSIDNLDDPVKFGVSNLVSFSPLGASSSGTVYLTDGRRELFAVVLFGPTVRVRVWRYDPRTGNWRR